MACDRSSRKQSGFPHPVGNDTNTSCPSTTEKRWVAFALVAGAGARGFLQPPLPQLRSPLDHLLMPLLSTTVLSTQLSLRFHTGCSYVIFLNRVIWLARNVQCVLHNSSIGIMPDSSVFCEEAGPPDYLHMVLSVWGRTHHGATTCRSYCGVLGCMGLYPSCSYRYFCGHSGEYM